MMQTDTVDFEAIKERQRMGWEAGDYPRVGNTLQLMANRWRRAASGRTPSTWPSRSPKATPSSCRSRRRRLTRP
jgi:hypothetical protein